MKLKNTLLIALSLLMTATVPSLHAETPEQKAERMEWFSKAKLGIFIHWGIYSSGKTSESWAFHNQIVTLEDYSGAFELPLFGQDWPAWGSYMDVGNTLYITAKCQPKQWDPSKLELRIGRIDFLADVKDTLVERITITVGLDALDEDTVLSLADMVKDSPGNTDLYFHILDPLGQMNLTMQSKRAKVSVKKDLISYIQSKPALSYKIN